MKIIVLWFFYLNLVRMLCNLFVTHGETYEEVLKNGQEVLELIIEEYQEDGKTLPQPKTFVFA